MSMGTDGFPTWDIPLIRSFSVDGNTVDGAKGYSFAVSAPDGALRMGDGNFLGQSLIRGLTAPLTLRTYIVGIDLSGVARQRDLYELVGPAMTGLGNRFELYVEWPFQDSWTVINAVVAYSLARPLAYGVIPGVSHATAKPRAWLAGVEQAIVTGSPSTGEVQLPDGPGQHRAATITGGVAAGTELRVSYYGILRGVAAPSVTAGYDNLPFRIAFEERTTGCDFS